MVSRRTERDLTPSWTKSGQGKMFFEPASGPQQQRQDSNNLREQQFKGHLNTALDLKSDAGRTPGEMLVNAAFATRDGVIDDGTGTTPTAWPAKGGLSGPPTLVPTDARDLTQGGWSDDSHVELPTRFADPSDKSIDRYEFQTPGMVGGTTLPGSIAAMPQRTLDRHFTDKTRALTPGEVRAQPAFLQRIGNGRQETTWRGGGNNVTEPGSRQPLPLPRGDHDYRTKSPDDLRIARDSLAHASAPGEGLGVGAIDAGFPGEFAGESIPPAGPIPEMAERVDEAAKSVVVSRMAKTLARDTTVSPDDMRGLDRVHTRASDDGPPAPGWYRGPGTLSVGDPVGDTPTLVHEIGHHVSTNTAGYQERVGSRAPVARSLASPNSQVLQHPAEEGFADDYRAANLPGYEGTGYRYTDAYFSSPQFASEYDHARKVPDRGDSAQTGRNAASRAQNLVRRVDPDSPSTRRVEMVANDVKHRLGPEPRKPGSPALFDRHTGEPFPERT